MSTLTTGGYICPRRLRRASVRALARLLRRVRRSLDTRGLPDGPTASNRQSVAPSRLLKAVLGLLLVRPGARWVLRVRWQVPAAPVAHIPGQSLLSLATRMLWRVSPEATVRWWPVCQQLAIFRQCVRRLLPARHPDKSRPASPSIHSTPGYTGDREVARAIMRTNALRASATAAPAAGGKTSASAGDDLSWLCAPQPGTPGRASA